MPGDNADAIGQLIHFLAKKLKTTGISPNSGTSDGRELFIGRARMSLGNLLFDAHHQMKRHMAEMSQRAATEGSTFAGQIDPSLTSFPTADEGAFGMAGSSFPAPISEATTLNPSTTLLRTALPATPESFDPDALMSTFEDFAYTEDRSFGME